MSPKVSVIILNWNQPEFTVDCVKSVLRQDYVDFEILVVDNGSRDDSVEIFKREFRGDPKIRVIMNPGNLGYAGGNNEGVKHSNGEYIVILNNDTIVEENWLQYLVDGIESDEGVGSVSSMEIREGRKTDAESYRKLGSTLSLLGYPARYRQKKPLENLDYVDVMAIRGVSFIYKKNLVELPFDPDYFIYAEDIYLSLLLAMKGYRNMRSTKSVIHHFHNITKKKGDVKINKYFIYLGERNRLMNILLFYETKNLFKILPLTLTGVLFVNLSEPRKIPSRLKSYMWLLSHPPEILRKRRYIQKQRKIPDEEVIKHMSCKLYEERRISNPVARRILEFMNSMFCIYCRIVNLKTVEIQA